MTRRTVGFCVTLACTLLVASLAAEAPPAAKVPRIGVLAVGSPPPSPDWKQRAPFWQELRTLGWIEGWNLRVEHRWAYGRADRLADLAVELVHLPVDVLVAVDDTLAIRAAQHATATIPIVMLSVGDPVAEGFVTGLARSGGNLTGVSAALAPELGGKLLEFLTEAVPGVTRIAILAYPGHPSTGLMIREVERVAQALGPQLRVFWARDWDEVERALKAATREGVGALLILLEVFFGLNRRRLAALSVTHQLPAIFWNRGFAEAGGLLAYGPHLPPLFRRAATYVDRILKGTKPADLPVEQATQFELVINLKTAQALGLTIPPSLLFQATEVIR
jgi:putative ABC transport system substrate-binding protein